MSRGSTIFRYIFAPPILLPSSSTWSPLPVCPFSFEPIGAWWRGDLPTRMEWHIIQRWRVWRSSLMPTMTLVQRKRWSSLKRISNSNWHFWHSLVGSDSNQLIRSTINYFVIHAVCAQLIPMADRMEVKDEHAKCASCLSIAWKLNRLEKSNRVLQERIDQLQLQSPSLQSPFDSVSNEVLVSSGI